LNQYLYNQQRSAIDQNFNKYPAYAGHVPPASRQPAQYSAQIVRQANTRWMPPTLVHQQPSDSAAITALHHHHNHQIRNNGSRSHTVTSIASSAINNTSNNPIPGSWKPSSNSNTPNTNGIDVTSSVGIRSIVDESVRTPGGAAVSDLANALNGGREVQIVKGLDISCKFCKKEANFMCSACKGVHYCSLDCQVCVLFWF
jgi:hypothetical protein